MPSPLILASGSPIRSALLSGAGLEFRVLPGRIDEPALRQALQAEGASARDIADALAEMKARKISGQHPEALVLGCDQVLEHGGDILSRPETPEETRQQLLRLRGSTHSLLSAAVLVRAGQPIWRHVGEARMTMRDFSDSYLASYLERNRHGLGQSVGGYKLEEEGVRLFARIDGSYFTVLGLPLVELLVHLSRSGEIDS